MVRCCATIVAGLFALVIPMVPAASADVGGQVPAPGGCDYPFIGPGGAAFGEYDQFCQGPLEINGSRWTKIFGGGMWTASVGGGLNLAIVNINAAVTTPVGVLRSIAYYACPDGSVADWPNPPGAWKNAIYPVPCKAVAPKPVLIEDGEQPVPPLGAIPKPVPVFGQTPAVVDPVPPNPEATDNPANR